jgi:hypothetical protein
MKHEPASKARHDAALRLMQRVEAITKQARAEIVPAPGDVKASLADRHLLDELEALRLAEYGAMRRGPDGYFKLRDRDSQGGAHHTTIQRLIDKGLLKYGNSVRTFVVLTESGRGGA